MPCQPKHMQMPRLGYIVVNSSWTNKQPRITYLCSLLCVLYLQALNSYVEQVARGITPRSTSVEFWVKDGEHLTRIDAQLPSTGSLGPLFFAFGLISEEELQAGTGRQLRSSGTHWGERCSLLSSLVTAAAYV